jgi:hypothetical protein
VCPSRSARGSQIGSRYFGFYRDGSTEQVTSHLLPYVDVINHGDDPNAWRSGAQGRALPRPEAAVEMIWHRSMLLMAGRGGVPCSAPAYRRLFLDC